MTNSFYVSPFNPAPFDAHMRIVSHIKPGSRVLDIGCNTGELGEQLKKRLDCYVVGVEMMPPAAEFAKTRLDEVICCGVMELPEQYPRSTKFDYILAADVLEHLPDPQGAVNLLLPYLRGGVGTFIASLPNVANYAIRLSLLAGRFDYDTNSTLSSGHLRFFTLRSAKSLLQNAGLVVETVDVSPGLFLWKPYHAIVERLFGRWSWYRHQEYLMSWAWKTMFAFQLILVGRKP